MGHRGDAAKGTGSASQQAELARKKRELKAMLAAKMAKKPMAPTSYSQEGLWFQDQVSGPNAAFNLKYALQLDGPLHTSILEECLAEVIRCHAVLRTTFPNLAGRPVQQIEPSRPFCLDLIDLNKLDHEDRRERVDQLVVREGVGTFDLAKGPMLRVKLVRTEVDQHFLLLTLHHIVFDGWSLAVLIREANKVYDARLRGEPSPLKRAPFQYSHFAKWQRDGLAGELFGQQVAYWKQQLAGAPQLIELPTDRPRGAAYVAGEEYFVFEPRLLADLKDLGRRCRASLFMTMLAAYGALLARYSGQDDLLIGSPHANRKRRETQNLIGFFVDTMIMRAELSDRPTVLQFLERIRAMTIKALTNQDVPFEKLVQELKPERKPGIHPLFQVMFILQIELEETFSLPGLNITDLGVEAGTGMFDLTLSCRETPEGLWGYLEYNAALYEAATIRQMVGHFRQLLWAMTHEPNSQLDRLNLLDEAERGHILRDWNQTAGETEVKLGTYQAITRWAEQTPDKIAVSWIEPNSEQVRHTDYAALVAESRTLAARLRARGVGMGSRVGIYQHRQGPLLVSVLAVWEVGAAYIPLDPTYPEARLAAMLDDARPHLILAYSSDADALGPWRELLLPLDRTSEARSGEAAAYLPSAAAYQIYSSGSTGKPKGIVVSHGALANAYHAWEEAYQLRSSDVHLQMASFSFDVFVGDLVRGLCSGARLLLCPRDWLLEPPKLYDLIEREEVTCAEFVPAVVRPLMDHVRGEGLNLHRFRLCVVGSDLWKVADLARLRALCHPEARVVNSYGVTEATIDSSYFENTSAPLWPERGVPIGRPFANTRLYILDRHLEPVPIGVYGQLYIAGHGLARGYLNRSAATAERFIPNPFDGQGTRLYHSGDLARYLRGDDRGVIEFLGRADFQVKIRGYRVELGDIEAALIALEGVREVVVVAVEDARGSKRPAAYLRLNEGIETEVATLRAGVKAKLPDYMVPAAFTIMERWPLTPNGKINRKALPKPVFGDEESEIHPPEGELEQTIAEVWQEILEVPRVGRHQDFFQLGGHSLMAVRIITRIAEKLGERPPVRLLFEHPTVAGLAAHLDVQDKDQPQAIPVRAPEDQQQRAPLSFSQQRLWFLDRLQPELTAYNLAFPLAIEGALSATSLFGAIEGLVERHHILSTTFVEADGQTWQQPGQPHRRPALIDLSGLDELTRQAALDTLTTRHGAQYLDATLAPPWRADLIRMGDDEHRLLLTLHHMLADDWSLAVIMRELSSHYASLLAGQGHQPSPPPLQYADYAIWQQQQESQIVEQLRWWKDQLAGTPELLDLPTDRARPAIQTYRGSVTTALLPAPLTRELDQLAQREGATRYMVLLAALSRLCSRLARQRDVVIGSSFATRSQPGLETLIGFFINMLPMRLEHSYRDSFKTLLARAKQVTLEAHAHEAAPFERIVNALQLQRDQSHPPLFQVSLTLYNAPRQEAAAAGPRIELVRLPQREAIFDLNLLVAERKDGALEIAANYNTDLFEQATVQAWMNHLSQLLRFAVEQPTEPLTDQAMVSEKVAREAMASWNPPQEDREPTNLARQFETIAARAPESIALRWRNESAEPCAMTYGELERRANQLAHYLARRGLRAGATAALCLARGPQAIIVHLAVVKSGVAYVPLDPAYPSQRLALMLQDTQPAVLISSGDLIDALPAQELTLLDIVDLQKEAHAIEQEESEPPNDHGGDQLPLYIMYTSGSTGRPKGVVIPQRAVARLVRHFENLDSETVMLQMAPISFDAATFEIWCGLLHGSQLAIHREPVPSLEGMAETLAAFAVNTAWLTAALFNHVVDHQPQILASLRHLLVGGEALSPNHISRLRALHPHIRLYNGYGPTENTTFSSIHPIEGQVSQQTRAIPIGRPINDSQAYVVDESLRQQPVGLPGELLLGGLGLAAGYHRQPGQTAQRFIPDPFSEVPGARLYRSGDEARRLPDGSIDFLGRDDAQIKLRGFRIELGEIEAALTGQPEILSAAVLLQGPPAGRYLVAYLVPAQPDSPPDLENLRQALAARLPAYMLPTAWRYIPKLPLTPNGKLDTRALLALKVETERDDETPLDEKERHVAELWTEVLHEAGIIDHGPIGRASDFFSLGGHSLLATRVMSRLREEWGEALPLRLVFESTSLAEFTAALPERKQGQHTHIPLLSRETYRHPDFPGAAVFPLSFAQSRLWFLNRMDAAAAYNNAFRFEMQGPIDIEALERAVNAIAARHEVLRTTFAEVDGQPGQIVHTSQALQLELLDLSDKPQQAASLALAEAAQPFDLARGPLTRLWLYRLASDRHEFLLTIHHIISDAWSLGIMVREILHHYQLEMGVDLETLPPLKLQYADYAHWHRRHITGEEMARQTAYWQEALAGAEQVLHLPLDHPRPRPLGYRGAAVPVRIEPALTQQLRALPQQSGTTLFMTTFAAYAALLSRYSGQDDFMIGTPIANRNHAGSEDLIGFFVNTLVLRATLSDDPSMRGLLARVRQNALSAYAHQDVPFEQLVETLAPARDTSRSPLFQVMFALQNAPIGELHLPGLRMRPLEEEREVAHFELTLELHEEDGGLAGMLEYNRDLFTQTTASLMVRRYVQLLQQVVAAPEAPLSTLQPYDAQERQRALETWRCSDMPPAQIPVHQRFIANAARLPERPASIAMGSGWAPPVTWTYQQLEHLSQGIAAKLIAAGAGPETVVGIFLQRSPALIASLLAVLRSGAAYLALDPNYPADRLNYMIEDAGVRLVICESQDAARIPEGVQTLTPEGDASELPERATLPEQAAYLIYTSGSTGRAKGAVATHRGLAAHCSAAVELFQLTEEDRVLQFAASSFDVMAEEVYPTLAAAATLVLAPGKGLDGFQHLNQALFQHGLTVLNLPATYWHQWLDHLPAALSQLRLLVVGSEKVQTDKAIKWLERAGVRLLNGYGPSETTVTATFFEPGQHEGFAQLSALPIGQPIAGCSAYVVDRYLQPTAPGLPGELYLAGPGLTRGYHRRPALTAERFIPNPFEGEGARLYQTGDLVRAIAGNQLAFLGRADSQIKLRGFRIEPGEIESSLQQHPAVGQALVTLYQNELNESYLVAYVQTSEKGVEGTLRAHLEQHLPGYMVPAAIMTLERLPQLPGGKINRRALPRPEIQGDTAYVAPRNELEVTLAAIWSEVLGVDRVGIHHNFFQMGGHSLMATRVVSRLQQATGVALPVAQIFGEPTVAQLARHVARLLKQTEGESEGDAAGPIPIGRDRDLPVSHAQRRLWFLDRLSKGGNAYNMPMWLDMEGPLSIADLERSLVALTLRHEALRTTFTERDQQLVQIISAEPKLDFKIIEVGHLSPDQRDELLEIEAPRPFELERGPLWRITLLRTDEEHHTLCLNKHHIISDGWSIGLFIDELISLYTAAIADDPKFDYLLPPLPLQYADYAVWQSERIASETGRRELAWWREQLADLPTLLNLPTDRPRPAGQTFNGAAVPMRLPEALYSSVRRMSRETGATEFMIMLGAFALFLGRYSRERDVAVGTPVANRARPELEAIMGVFINTLVLRVRLTERHGFARLLNEIQRDTLAAFSHQDVPFESLVEALQPERNLSHSPLFQVMLVLQNTPGGQPDMRGLRLGSREPNRVRAKFDLSLGLARVGETLQGRMEFNTDLFDSHTIERMCEHLITLLGGVLADPYRPLHAISLLNDQEREQVLHGWNDTARERAPYRAIPRMIAEQAAAHPDATALSWAQGSMTYAQLARSVNQAAHALRRIGIGLDQTVAVCIPRSPEMVIALLAVQTAGAAYLPIDPAYPSERVAYMLEVSNSRALITHGNTLESKLPVLDLQRDCDLIESQQETPPEGQIPEQATVYVIFTSGSTGKPKGVANSHGALYNRLEWGRTHYGLGERDRVLQKTPYSFDVSAWEIFSPLVSGACLVIAEDGGHRDPVYLANAIREHHVTLVHFVPSMLRAFLDQPGKPELPDLRQVICSGEALSAALVKRFMAAYPHSRIDNLYGPTEAAIEVSHHRCDGSEAEVPIGRPIDNLALYILDDRAQPLPAGLPGQLYLAGVGLARGYVGRPALTAEVFVPDPYASVAGARMYRSGDLARHQSQGEWVGSVHYLGRADHQVKLRGQRIEPGEIETALNEQVSVTEAAVLVQTGPAGEPVLVAHISPELERNAFETLRAELRKSLPAHMVPEVIVGHERLPVNANGKLDRRALAAQPLPGSDTEYRPPSSPYEHMVAEAWVEILALERIGRDDDFFRLGGHSLAATRVLNRLREESKLPLELQALFKYTVLNELAGHLDQLTPQVEDGPRLIALNAERAELSHAQYRMWFIDRLGTDASFNLPLRISLDQEISVTALESALTELVDRHAVLRTTFAATDRDPVQVIAPRMTVNLPVIEVAQGATVRDLVTREAEQPFDLRQGPLFRLTLLRGAERALLITLHHIIADGWSQNIFLRELAELYSAASKSQQPSLPPLPIQYTDYAVWQRQTMAGDEGKRLLKWWCEHLADLPKLSTLPTDHTRGAKPTRGGFVPLRLDGKRVEALETLAGTRKATLFMALQTAFALLLSRYTANGDQVLGTPLANRTRPELEGLIGHFVNMLVLRTRLHPEQSFLAHLDRVQEETLAAFAHQDLPFELLVEALLPERSLDHAPLFQIAIALHDLPGATPTGLPISIVEPVQPTAKYDLFLALTRDPEGLVGGFEYNAALYNTRTIEVLADRFIVLLDKLVAQSHRPMCEISLLRPKEQQALIDDHTRVSELPEKGLTTLFAEVVARQGESVALCGDQWQLSFAELMAEVEPLAAHLAGLGLRPGTFAAFCLPRGRAAIVTMLAIIQTGAAYLPLDPAHPTERLETLLADVLPRVLITAGSDAPSSRTGAERVCLEQLQLNKTARCPDRSDATLPAYVIYTSGSTGKPKGVMVTQQAVARLVVDNDYMPTDPSARLLHTAPLAFDGATYEIWGPLLGGGCCIVHEEATPGLDGLARTIAMHRPNRWFVTVALFNHIVTHRLEMLAGFEQIFVGGEALDPTTMSRALKGLPKTRLGNIYGPTECTTFSTTHPIDATGVTGSIPIGKPIPNTSVSVFDRHLNLQPLGVPGELLVGGAGLALGYLKRPGQTASRFVPHPFGDGERLYRTGDLVRMNENGELEFLGRIDDQIKIRGHRIEPGEVVALLLQHETVTEAAVVPLPATTGELQLIAFVVGHTEELKTWLAERLPAYLVPEQIIPVETLPLTANGKLDRQALAAMVTVGEAAFEEPETELEQRVAAIWRNVLREAGAASLPEIGRHDDFFRLGGQSLLATRVIAALRAELNKHDLPLRLLFEAPKLVDFCARLARHETAEEHQVVTQREGETTLPLSSQQMRLWFLDRLDAGGAYNIAIRLKLVGNLDVVALEQAISHLIARHEVLRTVFVDAGEQPEQRVQAPQPWSLHQIDLRETPTASTQLSALEARLPFDLSTGPMMRLILLHLADGQYRLMLTMHHIITDAWSLGIIVEELMAAYRAVVSGTEINLPRLPYQYGDYALRQRQAQAAGQLEDDLRYWQETLDGFDRVLQLPIDRPRPKQQRYEGGMVPLSLDATLIERLRRLPGTPSTTLYMILQAVFAVLLARYSGQQHLLIGSPVANRGLEGTQYLVGFFVNTLVMRIDLSGSPSFRELLGRVHRDVLAALVHSDTPFEWLVERLAPERDTSRSPLFQVMFNLINTPLGKLDLPGLDVAPEDEDTGFAHFELSLELSETSQGISGALGYNRDLFERETIERLAQQFQHLLSEVVKTPDQTAERLPLYDATARASLLQRIAGETLPLPDRCIHEMVLQQAARDGGAVALRDEQGETLSYAALAQRMREIAALVTAHGARPGSVVAVCLPRTITQVSCLLGVLQAGAAYLEISAETPPQRAAHMLDQAKVSLIIGDRPPCETTATVIEPGATATQNAPSPTIDPEWPAYISFTSGSSGLPKGVVARHRGVANYLMRAAEKFPVDKEDVVLQRVGIGFDAAMRDLVYPLTRGAQVILPDSETAKDPARLRQLAREQGATCFLSFVPTLLAAVCEADSASTGDLPKLRLVVSSGEALPSDVCRRVWAELNPDCRILNLYGPTETSLTTTVCEVIDKALTHVFVPLGQAMGNTEVLLLDDHLEPQAMGPRGRLYIAGTGLSPGYLGMPRETAAVFLPNPHGPAGSRLYDTGDLGRHAPTGLLFEGRADRQLELRGNRVEPGEIEARLRAYPAVTEAAVLVVDERLVAYLQTDTAADSEALRAHLAAALPSHMIPALFVTLVNFPLTATGKLDRGRLPKPEAAMGERPYKAPEGETEQALAAIWTDLLSVEPIGRDAHFFELGGHSLMATRVVARIRQQMGVTLPLVRLFEFPRLSDLAAAIADLPVGNDTPELVPIPRDEPLPLSYGQTRLWVHLYMEGAHGLYNMPAALQLHGPLDARALEGALRALVARHEVLRSRFEAVDDQPVLHLDRQYPAPLVLDLRGIDDVHTHADRLARTAMAQPFDLARDPLLRLKLIRLSDTEHLLAVTVHHILSDAWSLGLLVAELSELYRVELYRRPARLPELRVQYVDFAHWQRNWLAAPEFAPQLDFWRNKLAELTTLDLPLDRPRSSATRNLAGSLFLELSRDQSEQLDRLIQQQGVTLFMVTRALLDVLFAHHCKQTDITIGSQASYRPDTRLEPLIGFFINALVFRDTVDWELDFAEFLARVRHNSLEVFDHDHVPFDLLVDTLKPERHAGQTPLFQVLLNQPNVDEVPIELPALEVASVFRDRHETPYDLTFTFSKQETVLVAELQFKTDLFENTTAEHLLAGLKTLITHVLEDTRVPLTKLVNVLTGLDEQRQQARAEQARATSLGKLKRRRRNR